MNDSKPWYQSKTLWVNAVTLALAIIGVLVGSPWIAAYPQIAAGLVTATAVLNIVLRFLTRDGIEIMPPFPKDPLRRK